MSPKRRLRINKQDKWVDIHFQVRPDGDIVIWVDHANPRFDTIVKVEGAALPEEDRSMDSKVRTVILWTNGMVMVFDQNGDQMAELQGQYEDVLERICQVYNGPWRIGNWRGSTPSTLFYPKGRPNDDEPFAGGKGIVRRGSNGTSGGVDLKDALDIREEWREQARADYIRDLTEHLGRAPRSDELWPYEPDRQKVDRDRS